MAIHIKIVGAQVHVIDNNGIIWEETIDSSKAVYEFDVDEDLISGNIVKVVLQNGQPLHMAGVQVWGCATSQCPDPSSASAIGGE